MLGFDAYAKTTFGAILEQRIRVFFSKRFLINLPIILQLRLSGNDDDIKKLINVTFDSFKKQLKESGLYYHYAVSSILVDNPDYTFLISNEQETIQQAETSIFKIYSNVVNSMLGAYNPEQEVVKEDSLFSTLSRKIYHRFTPSYSGDLFVFDSDTTPIFKAPNTIGLIGSSPEEKKQNEDLRFSNDGKNVPISRIPSPLYIEYFWRLLPADKQTVATTGQEFKNIIGSEDKYEKDGKAPIENFLDLQTKFYYASISEKKKYGDQIGYKFSRGVRLMYNLTALIDEKDSTYGTTLGGVFFKLHPLIPTKWLPFSEFEEYKELGSNFPLPFLTDFEINNNGVDYNENGSFLQNAYLKMSRSKNPVLMKANKRTRPDNAGLQNSLYFSNNYGTTSGGKTFDVNQNFYWAYAALQNKNGSYPNIDFFKMRSSKSLISFEKEKILNVSNGKNEDWMNLYFPIVLAEQVSDEVADKNNGPEPFNDLVEELLKSDEVQFLKKIINYNDAKKLISVVDQSQNQTPDQLEKIIQINESNLKKLEKNETSQAEIENFYYSLPDAIRSLVFPNGIPYDKAVFFDVSGSEKSLDNLLLNLINFDEET